ncbi:hypothetical protein NQ314_002784 [Rhamnusium bicolor]|uniref:Uncharacterized protein n=1 Tax=Rhamnusium bicolor TaxID=1586634 RepID=A0AAV8ZPQ6_9CUCU|nr:hypothetical protein NQ314_002784 [Rhamnusium bicolor]
MGVDQSSIRSVLRSRQQFVNKTFRRGTATTGKMAEISNLPVSENLNIKNGNFICGVVEGISFVY